MDVRDTVTSVSAMAKLMSSESGVINQIQIGASGVGGLIPSDCNMFASRDVILLAGESKVLKIENFKLDAEPDPFPTIDGEDTNLQTVYLVMFILLTKTTPAFVMGIQTTGNLGQVNEGDIYMTTHSGAGVTGVFQTYTLRELSFTTGQGVVRCIAFGKDTS